MPLRLFPFAFALILGAVYLLGGFDRGDGDLVSVFESRRAVEHGVVYALSEDKMHGVEDFIIGLTDPFRSAIDLPFD